MKKQAILIILMVSAIALMAYEASANDVQAYNVTLQNYRQNGASPNAGSTVDIKFDLSQKNIYTANDNTYDRVWIFAKYCETDEAGTPTSTWGHATLVAGGSVKPYNNTKLKGLVNNNPDNTGTTYVGAFCEIGANQTIRWAIGQDNSSFDPNKKYKVRILAIEMVYIPTGAFYVGTTGRENSSFTNGSWTSGDTINLQIASDSVTVGHSAGKLWINETTLSYITNRLGADGALPAAFPKGYNGFFIMKYETSQQQYLDFLNMLSRKQQGKRTHLSIGDNQTVADYSSTYGYRIYAMSSTYELRTNQQRNAIVCPKTFLANKPIAFYFHDKVLGDGYGGPRACNFMTWMDLTAYLDWAGLRPMTDLEFEKACRGPAMPVKMAYAWGTTNITQAQTPANDGTASEGVTQSGNGLANYNGAGTDIIGPLRGGFAAKNGTNREQSGASYYGVMELSGNVAEIFVNVNSNGRLFDGSHGDGKLTDTGYADNPGWPGYIAGNGVTGMNNGVGTRGGGFNGTARLVVADRSGFNENVDAYTSCDTVGGRGVRTEPQ